MFMKLGFSANLTDPFRNPPRAVLASFALGASPPLDEFRIEKPPCPKDNAVSADASSFFMAIIKLSSRIMTICFCRTFGSNSISRFGGFASAAEAAKTADPLLFTTGSTLASKGVVVVIFRFLSMSEFSVAGEHVGDSLGGAGGGGVVRPRAEGRGASVVVDW